MSEVELNRLCAEINELAERIGATGPACGEAVGVGYGLSLCSARKEYVLSYAERGVPDVVLQSFDGAAIKERYFNEVTSSMAAVEVAGRYPPVGPWSPFLDWLIQPSSIKWQREYQIVQEALLGRLDSGWKERTAIQNALRLRETIDTIYRVRGRSIGESQDEPK